MNQKILRTLSILLLLTLLYSPTPGQALTISFRSDYWCPYICNPRSEKPGYIVEIARQVFEKHGYKVEVKLTDWLNAIKDTRNNKAQGLMGCSKVDAPDFIFTKSAIGIMRNAYFTTANSKWTFSGRSSLYGKKIGVIRGYTYGDSIDGLIRAGHRSFIIFNGEFPLKKMLKSLHAGELDSIIESPAVLQHSFLEAPEELQKLRVSGWVENQSPALYIAFPPNHAKSKEYAALLEKGIESLRQSGELQRILEKYNLRDWGPELVGKFSLGALDNSYTGLLKSPFNSINMFDTRSL